MATTLLRLGLACVLATACATSPTTAGGTGTRAFGTGGHNLLGVEEIGRWQGDLDLYRALELRRPDLLRARPGSYVLRGTRPNFRVYVDGIYAGDVEALRMLRVSDVVSVRRLQPSEALMYPALSLDDAGVIVVTTRR